MCPFLEREYLVKKDTVQVRSWYKEQRGHHARRLTYYWRQNALNYITFPFNLALWLGSQYCNRHQSITLLFCCLHPYRTILIKLLITITPTAHQITVIYITNLTLSKLD